MSLEEMRVITKQDGIYIARAIGFAPVDVLDEYIQSPRYIEKLRTRKVVRIEGKYSIITRWEKEENGWELSKNGVLHPESIHDREYYAPTSIDIIGRAKDDVLDLLGLTVRLLDFHYRQYDKGLAKTNKGDMKRTLLYISEEAAKMKEEEKELERKAEMASRN